VRHFAVLALALASPAPSIARAELPTFIPSAVPPEPDRPFVFAAPHLGLNAPLGLLGLELGAGYEWFRASVGAGAALGGLQLAATVRAMTRFSSVDVGIGLGASRGGALHELDIAFGETSGEDDPPGTVQYDSNTLWMNLEVVLELPLPGGAFTRFYGGITSPLYVECVFEPDSGPDEPCDWYQREELRDERYQPFVGFATGFRWPQPPRARGVWLPSNFAAPPPPLPFPVFGS
jgi:hypothetical protein